MDVVSLLYKRKNRKYLSKIKIVYLQGGLGNQLFQYAFARALGLRFGCQVKLDDSFFENQTKRVLSLGRFNSTIQTANDVEIKNALEINTTFLEKLLGYLLKTEMKNSRYIEKSLSFDNACFSEKDKKYFRGYWQSEKYFKNIEEIIRKELIITPLPSEQNAKTINTIKSQRNAVSLHIRRGDYISDSRANEIHGVCGLDYYRQALNLLKSRIGEFDLYVFSDDINWAKYNLEFPCNKVFVDWNDDVNNYEDLRLMSLCKHNIIANSTFSWWGAWLNQNPDKIVIAPKQWFADSNKNNEPGDIVPESWIKL
jgi:hypothetical protein